jgi:ribosomal protein L24
MSGSQRGKEGRVLSVNTRSGRITIDTIKRKTARGKEFNIPVYASAVYITDLNLDDKLRAAKFNLKAAAPSPKREEKPAPKEAKAEAAAPAQGTKRSDGKEVIQVTKV